VNGGPAGRLVSPRAVLGVAVLAVLLTPASLQAQNSSLRAQLHQAWMYFDAGNLREAEERFVQAMELPQGRRSAELHYGLSLVSWKRGLARESYLRLQAGLRAAGQEGWDAGEGGEWQRRIAARIRYIERNFAAATLRFPAAGKPLVPLLEPSPRDPVLRRFDGAARALIEKGTVGFEGALRVFLPSGGYWVGDNHIELAPGELAAGHQKILYLPVARGPLLRRHQARRALQKQGTPIPPPAVAAEEGPEASSRTEPSASAAAVDGPGREPLHFRVVRSYLSARTAEEISQQWPAVPFHVQYGVYCPDGDTEHQLNFPDYGFYVQFDPGGVLRVRGEQVFRVALGSDWLVGDSDVLNQVELRFDGSRLWVMVNGLEFGPIQVRSKPAQRPGQWKIRISDDRARMIHLFVHPLR